MRVEKISFKTLDFKQISSNSNKGKHSLRFLSFPVLRSHRVLFYGAFFLPASQAVAGFFPGFPIKLMFPPKVYIILLSPKVYCLLKLVSIH